MDAFLNLLIFAITALAMLPFFRKNGTWSLQNAAPAFRFFTVLSNLFCAFAALMMFLMPSKDWVWTLKYVAVAAVSVTMLTVLAFLGPTLGYKKQLTGSGLFMHLVTPLLAIGSFCLLEKRPLAFPTAMLGMLPVLLYGVLYVYKVVYAPAGERWEDFYGFNRGGKWPLSFALMLLGTFGVCMALMLLQNR